MSKWREIARRTLKGNGILGGLERIKTDDLIAKYPDCISITGVQLVEYADVSYPVFTFAEDPTKYFTGGMKLRALVNAWVEDDPSLEEANAGMKAKPLKVRMQKIRTKSGNTYTDVQEIEDADKDDELNFDAETGEIIGDPF